MVCTMELSDYIRPKRKHDYGRPPKHGQGVKNKLLEILTTTNQSFCDLAIKIGETEQRVKTAARNLQGDKVNLTISSGCVRLRKTTSD